MPSHKEIVRANLDLIKELGILEKLADRTCWCCRKLFSVQLVRAHIIGDRFGGSSEPENFLILCNLGHESQPDSAPREYQLEWLRKGFEPTETESVKIIEQSFKSMTGYELQDLLNKMIDEYGTQGMLDRFRPALTAGNTQKAGNRNGKANAVYELVTYWRLLNRR